jgi:hypothetical protein
MWTVAAVDILLYMSAITNNMKDNRFRKNSLMDEVFATLLRQ